MKTERRVDHWQRTGRAEQSAGENVVSIVALIDIAGFLRDRLRPGSDGGVTASRWQVTGAAALSVLLCGVSLLVELATNSLGWLGCCLWRCCHERYGLRGENSREPAADLARCGAWMRQIVWPQDWAAFRFEAPAGQPFLNSPPLVRAFPLQFASPLVPGKISGTERHHGQRNLYLQYPSRDASRDPRGRSAFRDLLRA
uniref:Uncharacterized protein n=1 Tax=mine drainage metagenome TaxID=410659 RepID=E6QJS6_9ZZZZ